VIQHRGDIHHLFPRDYLKKEKFTRSQYKQVANYVYTQTEINIKIGNKSPAIYFAELQKQCQGGELKYGGICDMDELKQNMFENEIPAMIFTAGGENYSDLLEKRRILMAKKIEKFYYQL
jgi:hypothetical protein